MKFTARHPEQRSAGAYLHHLLVQLGTLAADDLRRLRVTPEHSMHALRTRMKKIRSLLRLAREHGEPEALEAISITAREIKDAFDSPRNHTMILKLRHSLDGKKQDAVPLAQSPAGIPAHVGPRMRKLRRLIAALPLKNLRWSSICRAHARTFRACRHRMKQAAHEGGAEPLHGWRKRVKDLYYQSLALHRLGGFSKQVRRSRKLASHLGKHHDLEVLRDSAHPPLSPAEMKHLQRKQDALEKDAFALGTKLLHDRPKEVRRELLRRCDTAED